MKIFDTKDGVLNEYTGNANYYNCKIVSGGYGSNEGFYATIQPFGGYEMTFRIKSHDVYKKIIDAYLSGETIGLVL